MKKKKKIKLITDGVGFDTFAVFPSRLPEGEGMNRYCTLLVIGHGFWDSKLVKGSYNNYGEKSIFVPNITKEDAMDQIKRYGVESIVFAERATYIQDNIEYSSVKMDLIYADGRVAGTRIAKWKPENGWNYHAKVSGQEFYVSYFDNGMVTEEDVFNKYDYYYETTYGKGDENVLDWFVLKLERLSSLYIRYIKRKPGWLGYVDSHYDHLYSEVDRYESRYYDTFENRYPKQTELQKEVDKSIKNRYTLRILKGLRANAKNKEHSIYNK